MIGLILLITGIWLCTIGHPVFGAINIICMLWLNYAGTQIMKAAEEIDKALGNKK
jgi:threonine/homoserine/homoserine lactone efflux protein